MTSATAYWPSMGSPRASKYSASVRQCHSSPPRGLRNLSSAGTDMMRGSSPARPSAARARAPGGGAGGGGGEAAGGQGTRAQAPRPGGGGREGVAVVGEY